MPMKYILSSQDIQQIAGCIANIMINKAPSRCTMHILGGMEPISVEITPVTNHTEDDIKLYGPSGFSVWDGVKINGQSCGNRHGGKKEVIRIINEFLGLSPSY